MIDRAETAGERYYTIDGKLPEAFEDDELTSQYETKDGGIVRLNMNFPQCVPFLLGTTVESDKICLATRKVC